MEMSFLREQFISLFGARGEDTLARCAAPYEAPGESIEQRLAKSIDHTLLKPDADINQVRGLCEEAKAFSVASVCVNSVFIPLVKESLEGTAVKVCSVVGFPLGAMNSEAKAYEAALAVKQGADEIDMVIALGYIKSGAWERVEHDIAQVRMATSGKILKVILETSLLTQEEKILAAFTSVLAKADFVKTSTGFANGGATLADVSLLRVAVGKAASIKASGGIRTRQEALAFLKAGADRIGASQTKVILGL